MAIAVDCEGHAGLDRRARMFAVQVEVTRGSVDLEGRPGLRRRGIDGGVIQLVAVPAAHQLVGRVSDDVDEGMLNRR